MGRAYVAVLEAIVSTRLSACERAAVSCLASGKKACKIWILTGFCFWNAFNEL